MIQSSDMSDGYKQGGKVKKAKKVKKVKKVSRRKSTAKRALPPLTTGTLGTGMGSYQATIGAGAGAGGAFQAPSYFRAVGSSQEYGVVPPVLREFVEQQRKMLEDINKKKKEPPVLPPSSAPVLPPGSASSSAPYIGPASYYSSGQSRKGTISHISSYNYPSYFPPASGASMKPTDANIDSPSSNYVPLRASRPDDLSESASMSSAVASSASSSVASSADVEGKQEAVQFPLQPLPKMVKYPRTVAYHAKKLKEQEERERQERERQEQSQEQSQEDRQESGASQASGAF